MTFSNIFDRIESKLIGLKFVGSSISPDLWDRSYNREPPRFRKYICDYRCFDNYYCNIWDCNH